VGTADLERRLGDRKARAAVCASIGVLFAFAAGASFAGVLPSQLRLLAAGLALVGFVAAALFTGEARGVEGQLAELKVQREPRSRPSPAAGCDRSGSVTQSDRFGRMS